MKVCPNCDYENFDNLDICDGCHESIHDIRSEFFTIVDFVKKNSALYAVIGIFLGLFRYFVASSNSIVRSVSLIPLFVSVFLMFSLIIKGYRIVDTQPFQNIQERYINSNSFELWVFSAINICLIIGLVVSSGTEYVLSICLLGTISLAVILYVRRIAHGHPINTFLLNVMGVLAFEIGLVILKFILPYVISTTDPTIFFWALMIPLSFLFIGLGSVMAGLFISEWLMITEAQTPTQHQMSMARLHEEFSQYIQPFRDSILIRMFTGLVILCGIFLVCLYSKGIL